MSPHKKTKPQPGWGEESVYDVQNSLAHTVWDCNYHVIHPSRKRRKPDCGILEQEAFKKAHGCQEDMSLYY